jgi:hypothetical protein
MVRKLDTIVEVDDVDAIEDDEVTNEEGDKMNTYASCGRAGRQSLPKIAEIPEPEWEPDVGRNSLACLVLEHGSPQVCEDEIRCMASAIAKPKDANGMYDEPRLLGSEMDQKPFMNRSTRRKRRESLIDKAARQEQAKLYAQEMHVQPPPVFSFPPAYDTQRLPPFPVVTTNDYSTDLGGYHFSEYSGLYDDIQGDSEIFDPSACSEQSSRSSGSKRLRHRRRESLIDKASRLNQKRLQQEQVYLDMAEKVFDLEGTDEPIMPRDIVTFRL